MKTRIPKSLLGVPVLVHLLSIKAEAATLPLAQIPTNVKTGFQYGLGLLFMIGFPKLLEYYQELPKEQLIRKLVLGKMQRAGYANQRNEEIIAWVEEHPDIKAKIEARVKNVPEANRQRAFLTAAKTEAMNQAVKPSQGIRA